MKTYLVENRDRDIKECYSNLKKIAGEYPISYWGMYAAIRNKGIYRNSGYTVTKMIIK